MSVLESIVMTMELPEAEEPTPTAPTKYARTLFNDRFKVVIGGSFSPDDNTNQNLKENLIDDVSLEYMLDKEKTC